MNNVQVCNLALGRIGSSAIQSLDIADTSESAAQCRVLLQPTLDTLLLEPVVWPFALRAAALAVPSGVTVPGWSFVYRQPGDCARLLAITDAQTDPFRQPGLLAQVARPYRLLGDGDGVLLACEQDSAWAWYTVRVTDVTRASAAFCDVLAWRLAAELALALKASAALWDSANKGAQSALVRAAAMVARQAGPIEVADSESIQVRG